MTGKWYANKMLHILVMQRQIYIYLFTYEMLRCIWFWFCSKRISMLTKYSCARAQCTLHIVQDGVQNWNILVVFTYLYCGICFRIEVDVLLDAVVSNFTNRNDFKLGFYAFAKSWCPSNSLTAKGNKQNTCDCEHRGENVCEMAIRVGSHK